MILWNDDAHDVAENMRRDAALLRAAEARADFRPVLRLFGFDPPGITLGMSQRPERVLDLARCDRDGVAYAVRPTGGRAIFHAEEWTYSLTARLDDAGFGGGNGAGSLALAYAAISRLLVAALRRLGIAAELAPGHRTHGGGIGITPCFASTAAHEIVLAGRKLVGSAQRRTATAVLQQGSILLGPGHLRIVQYLTIPDAERATVAARLERASTWATPAEGGREALVRALAAETGCTDVVRGETGAMLTLSEAGSILHRA